MEKNDIFIIDITDMDVEGLGIGHHAGYTVFVHQAIVGERVKVQVLKKSKTVLFAKVVEYFSTSDKRVTASCIYYPACGGCNLMHIDYQYQLEIKKQMIIRTLEKQLGHPITISNVIGSENPFHYRNKIQAPISENPHLIRGFFQERSHYFIPIEECLIEPRHLKNVFQEILTFLETLGYTAYREETHTGDIRHIVLRTNRKQEVLAIIVATKNIAKQILKQLPFLMSSLTSLYLNIHTQKNNVILGQEFIHLAQEKYLTEEIDGLSFQIHPNSFFQVNYEQMYKLYHTAIQMADLSKEDRVIDAYCGIGTISLLLSRYVKEVFGLEVVQEAVRNAEENKQNNRIENVSFLLGKCEDNIDKLIEKQEIDCLFMDPPRKGSDDHFLNTLIHSNISKIVYISCGVKSLANDLKRLSIAYEIKEIQCVDLFPQTNHIECVVLMSRIN